MKIKIALAVVSAVSASAIAAYALVPGRDRSECNPPQPMECNIASGPVGSLEIDAVHLSPTELHKRDITPLPGWNIYLVADRSMRNLATENLSSQSMMESQLIFIKRIESEEGTLVWSPSRIKSEPPKWILLQKEVYPEKTVINVDSDSLDHFAIVDRYYHEGDEYELVSDPGRLVRHSSDSEFVHREWRKGPIGCGPRALTESRREMDWRGQEAGLRERSRLACIAKSADIRDKIYAWRKGYVPSPEQDLTASFY